MHDGDKWAAGAARYGVRTKGPSGTLLVEVRCRLGTLGVVDVALLDTGAEWSVVPPDVAELLEDGFADDGEKILMLTRYGRIEGSLRRLQIELVADIGSPISVDASVFLPKHWEGPIVLGYMGFLERIRFALDPGSGDGDSWFYFGEVSDVVSPDGRLL